MLSNVTTPLIGAVDMAVLGQKDVPHLIGATALSANIFSMVFWAFGFLRMGTTGFAAQADGAGDRFEVLAVLSRALFIAFVAGVCLLLLQYPIKQLAFYFIPGSEIVEGAARTYFDIRIWSAPATLANYALLGWFIGLGRADLGLALQLLLNGLNIVLDAWFVLGLDMGIVGVAYGTVLSEVIAALVGIILATRIFSFDLMRGHWGELLQANSLKNMMSVNGDIMIRTLCLLFAFMFMTAQSAGIDDVTLAANAVLLTFLSLSAYFLDGFAYSAERFVGYAIGAKSKKVFNSAVLKSTFWAFVFASAVSLSFWIFADQIIQVMTVSSDVQKIANDYLFWAIMAPIIGVACFQLDGIFIGATQTKDMRNMMIVSLLVYLMIWYVLSMYFGNHGLWAAFMVFFIVRAVTLFWKLPQLMHRLRVP